jgi:hypothetical protein
MVMIKQMTKSGYQEYKKILYDTGKFDNVSVVNDVTPEAKAQRLFMRTKLIEFEKEHGEVHEHLVKSGRDYAQYCMIVNG